MTWEDYNDFMHMEVGHIGDTRILMEGVLGAFGVFLITYIAVKIWRRTILKPRIIMNKIDEKRRISIFLIVKYIGWVISILIAIKVLGFNITPLLFGSGALLIGLGFGLQNIFRDFVSGLFLLFEGSLKIGDVIEVDGEVGRVKEINLRSSEMVTVDDVTIVIPNSKFVSERVVNWSMDNELVRFEVNVGVAYGSDVDEVFKCLEDAMRENKDVTAKPKPFVRFKNFGDSALEFEMIFWSRKGFIIENVKSDLRRDVYRRLTDSGLAIPFPQRDVHISGLEDLKNFTKTTEK
ncbi:MAG: mechanosensitive ion channel family protein [Fluviicola sp.]